MARFENQTAEELAAKVTQYRSARLAATVLRELTNRAPCVGGREVTSTYGPVFTVGTADETVPPTHFWVDLPDVE